MIHETPEPSVTISQVPAPEARPRRGGPRLLLFGLAMFFAGSLIGAVTGAGMARIGAPAAVPPATVPPLADLAAADPYVAAVEKVLPAVVTVINLGSGGTQVGTGSGVIIDRELGYIVTNSHVIETTRTVQPAASIEVVFSDGTRKPATVVGNDPTTDVAVLRVAGPLPAEAALGDVERVPLGAQVIAIGSPGISSRGARTVLENTITSGVVSGKGRSFPRADLRGNVVLRDLIQTDASINPGNSGGPLVWVATREVIGLNTLVVRSSGEEGLGFAVSSATVREVAARIIAQGSAP